MKLIDMKLNAEEKAEYGPQTPLCDSDYPYGLRITLDDDAISEVFKKMPEVGESRMLCVMVTVCTLSQYEKEGSENEKTMGLQITAVGEMPMQGSKKDPASSLYGKGS